MMSLRRSAALLVFALGGGSLGGCASLDALAVAETHRLNDAPYYRDLATPAPAPGACALVLPVTLDPELTRVLGYSDRVNRLQPIREALNARLAQRDGCVTATTRGPIGPGAPHVYVGTSDSEFAPAEAAAQRLETDRVAPMVLHVERAGDPWRQAVIALADAANTPYVLAVQLGVSQYAKGYSGVFSKEVALGTGYRAPIRLLSADDAPVDVLHLTGVLLDAQGRAVRAGAEGVIFRDTPFGLQVLDVTKVIDDLALERVLSSERRADLPGAPRALDVALDNLLAQLTRGAPIVPAR